LGGFHSSVWGVTRLGMDPPKKETIRERRAHYTTKKKRNTHLGVEGRGVNDWHEIQVTEDTNQEKRM